MRYLEVDDIVFTDKNGNSFTIKDMREYPDQSLLRRYSIQKQNKIDEIASRLDIYGDGGEKFAYKIFDMNRIAIVEGGFSLEKITEMDIPVL